jgi:hypothetical protein
MDSLERPRQQKIVVRFGTWVVRSPYRAGSLKTVSNNTLLGKPEGNRPPGIHRHRWEDDIRIELREIGSQGVDWIYLAQDKKQWRSLVNMLMNFRVPKNAANFLTS